GRLPRTTSPTWATPPRWPSRRWWTTSSTIGRTGARRRRASWAGGPGGEAKRLAPLKREAGRRPPPVPINRFYPPWAWWRCAALHGPRLAPDHRAGRDTGPT